MELTALAYLATVVLSSLLLGSMLFFAAIVAPTVFAVGPAEQSGRLLRALFPRYYAWGMALALPATVAAFRVDGPAAVVLAIVTILFVFLRQILLAFIQSARQAHLAGEAGAGRRFKLLHLASVVLNLAQMVAVAAVIVRVGMLGLR